MTSVGDNLRSLGKETAALYAFAAQAWAAASGLVLLLLATSQLTPSQQGYFFTFSSLLLVQSLIDVGFAVVLTQFVSHEWAHLRLEGGRVVGDDRAAPRLASLLRLGLRWYGVVAVALLVGLGVGGHLFFTLSPYADAAVDWTAPWWTLCGATALAALAVPLSASLEGTGQVAANQRSLLLANVMAGLAAWLALLLGAHLWSVVVLVGVRALLAHAQLIPAAWPLLRLTRELPEGPSVGWRTEFWPQQWRIAASWAAGLLMFQSFVPIAFQVQGPVLAGQVGVLTQAFRAVNQLGSAWLTAAQPEMGHLAALGRADDLRTLVRTTVQRCVATAAVIALSAFAFIAVLEVARPRYAERFGDLLSVATFVGIAVALQLSNVETAAIRFQKSEPFVMVSWIAAVALVVSNVLLGYAFGTRGIGLGFMAVTLCLLIPWVHNIYQRDMMIFQRRAEARELAST